MLTRREFLKYTAIGGAAILGASFLGCIKKEEIPKESLGTTEIIDTMGRKVNVEVPVDRVVITFNVEEFIAVGGKEALTFNPLFIESTEKEKTYSQNTLLKPFNPPFIERTMKEKDVVFDALYFQSSFHRGYSSNVV